MAYPRRAVPMDEELGKKYDDHRRPRNSLPAPATSRRWFPRRSKRLALCVVGLFLLYLFFKNMPTDLRPATERMDYLPRVPRVPTPRKPVEAPPPQQQPIPQPPKQQEEVIAQEDGPQDPQDPPPRPEKTTGEESATPAPDYYYEDRVRFYKLSKSLDSPRGAEGSCPESNPVVFAAADLKSVSDLLPLACDMARKEINCVHFALTGRHTVSIEGIEQVNGINRTDCPFVWHDGRPDYAAWSTDSRMQASVKAALGHIAKKINPRILITHDDIREEPYFWAGMRARANELDLTHLALPGRAANFKWVANLDASSLEAWHKIQVDILIQAAPQSAGGLIRLLKSLTNADYFGPAPRLTIELPSDADPALVKYLSDFVWPPDTDRHDFTLRRRIHPRSVTPEEASIRMIDAIYPKDPAINHVLVLSPQVELNPSYYHYLKYTLLRYKYSAMADELGPKLLGISLELPSSNPTNGEPFSSPTNPPPPSGSGDLPLALWQVPNGHATLYLGDKWTEFQSFLSNRFSPALKSKQTPLSKLQPGKFPAWMDYMSEFIRARGYFLLFPVFATANDLALVSVHGELSRQPEEYDLPSGKSSSEPGKISTPNQPSSDDKVLTGAYTISNILRAHTGKLPGLSSLPLLSYSGKQAADLLQTATEYQQTFTREVGGCADDRKPPASEPLKADDLFCLEGAVDGQ